MNTNERQCPACLNIIVHKTEKDAKKAKTKNKPCRACMYETRKMPEQSVCPLCNFVTKKHTVFDAHLISTHNKSAQQLWNEINSGPILCKCGCQQQTTWCGWSKGYAQVIIGHNANLVAFHGEEKAKEVSDKRKKSLEGQVSWCKGLTKETDERIKLRGEATSKGRKKAFDKGTITIWSKGLTKETDERLAAHSEQIKSKFNSGERISWHKGLSEETDDRVKQKNNDLRESYKTGRLVQWHKGLTKETDSRIEKFWASRDVMKEFSHVRFSHKDIKIALEKNMWLILQNIEQYKNVYSSRLLVRCVMCDYFDTVSFCFAKNDRCPNCCQIGSKNQLEITSFIEAMNIIVAKNVRGIIGNRQELDIYVPAHKFAIEFNGLYWHNEAAGKGENYHQNKTDACLKLGISLFHVFEDEWRDKREIVESMIRHRLKSAPRNINARQYDIKELTISERRSFFEKNHIDGDTNSRIAFGLFNKTDNELISAISLRTPFHKKHNTSLEIARFCNVLNTNVRGGLSKLSLHSISYAKEHDYSTLMSYVDARMGSGLGWTNSGWKLTAETPPRFWWTDNTVRFNRFKFKADRKNCLTESQVAEAANVVKIFGCKNLCFEYVI